MPYANQPVTLLNPTVQSVGDNFYDCGALSVDATGRIPQNISVRSTYFSGTGTMTTRLQYSHDNGASWAEPDTAQAFTAQTTPGTLIKAFPIQAPRVRVVINGGAASSFASSLSIVFF